ncbi:hypothetical protein BI036_gp021 [Morganella phage vB_MmoM_MP1]|uniref:Uncharacterized protein n=1 Tax=Morganella phage vB_MmoM_MP1 TaxID=1852628 RepID=A0A192YA72_9CAUD|nr:hypothetical protein BI036_gp021 [Morganella phage vB_MmoM_MP1]ANM46447.1 hypothetical protein MP1_gp0021 [Morganella phage vB_MmoM_MP1]
MFNELINSLIEARKKAYIEHRQRIIARAEELNAGWMMNSKLQKDLGIRTVQPTEGKDGRLHAPFDGYLWEHPRTGSIDEYGGGQYLPVTDEWDDMEKPDYTFEHGFWKLRLTEEMYISLLGNSYIETKTPYKKWTVSNTPVCMVEVRTHKEILKAIQEYSEKVFDDLYAETKKDKGIAPEGKQTVKGTIVRVKTYEDFYGVTSKMTVELENKSTVYGSLPKCVPLDYRGTIEFKATFEQAKDDNTHAFFKRPSSVEIESNLS